jgi:hypothetical protein
MEVELKVGETKELEDGLKITLRDIIYEELAENLPDYPGGSGVVAELVLRLNGQMSRMMLDQLPEGYESHFEKEWEGFRVKLVEVVTDNSIIIQTSKSVKNSKNT